LGADQIAGLRRQVFVELEPLVAAIFPRCRQGRDASGLAIRVGDGSDSNQATQSIFDRSMTPSPRTGVMVAFILLILAGVVWVDCATGVEVSVFFLYFIPVILATWHFGVRSGLAMALAASLAHRWADWESMAKLSHNWQFWERGASGFVTLAIVAFSLHIFRAGRKADRDRIRQLEELLHCCPGCSRLRQANGGWKNLATCLRELKEMPPENRLCPECAAVRELHDYSL
jgi:hypothetical protein